MPEQITRSYLQARHRLATFAMLFVLALTVIFGSIQLYNLQNNARYQAAFVSLFEAANSVEHALLHQARNADGHDNEAHEDNTELKSAILSLAEVFTALRLSDPDADDLKSGSGEIEFDRIAQHLSLNLSQIEEKFNLASRGMPDQLEELWENDEDNADNSDHTETVHEFEALETSIGKFLSYALEVQEQTSSHGADVRAQKIHDAEELFDEKISPMFGSVAIAIRQSSDQSMMALFVVLAIGAVVSALAALFNATFIFRPMVNSIEEHQTALTTERDRALVSVQAKKEFLAVMSHELRTPMNGVLGFANLALRTDLTESQRDYVETIKNSGESLLDLLNSILDISKIEAGSLELEPHRFSMQETIDSAVQLMAAQAFEKRLDLTHFVDPELPSELLGDSGLIRKLVLNLVGNAIKFTEDGGVSIEVLAISDYENRNAANSKKIEIEVRVTDTGIGIPEDKLDLIFDRFSQADSSERRLYEGTGLGLAICREISDLMGGRIWVESQVGSGSSFRAILRMEQVEPEAPSLRDVHGRCLQNARVLVIDDNAVNCRIAKLQLEAHGARCQTVLTAEEAMEALSKAAAENDPFNLCVIDQMMPRIDGPTMLQKIKADERFEGLLAILSSSAGVRTDAAARELGFDAAVPKPVNQNQLVQTSATLISQKEVERREIQLDHMFQQNERPTGTMQDDDNSHRLLVVEDNVANLKLATLILEAAGYSVDKAVNGVEAIAAVSRFDYDAILMDIRMPVMDGLEATQRIKLLPGNRSMIPIIAMTADVAEIGETGLQDAGIVDLISKPIDEQKLLTALSNHIAGKADTAA